MGYYTGLRVDCIVKPEYIPVLEFLHREDVDGWEDTAKRFPQYDFLAKYANYSRADFIPFGGSAYFGDEEWIDFVPGPNKDEDGDSLWNKTHFEPETGRWCFACSLKNYERTIDFFRDTILNEIALTVTMYEAIGEDTWFDILNGVDKW
jgi:hypothetical protein